MVGLSNSKTEFGDMRDHKLWERAASDFIKFVKGNRGKDKDILRSNLLFPMLFEAIGDVKGKRVLDAGSGEGSFAQMLEEKGALVSAFDVSAVMVAEANKRKADRGLKTEFKQVDIEEPGIYPPNSFDVIVSSMVLFELDDAEQAFRNMVEYLAPKGRLVISILHPAFDMNDSQRISLGTLTDERMTRTHWSFEIQHPYSEEIRYERNYTFTDKAIPYYFRPINYYVKMFIKNSLKIVSFEEPTLTYKVALQNPQVSHAHFIPRFLIIGGDKE